MGANGSFRIMAVEILFLSPIWRAEDRGSAMNVFNIDHCIPGVPRPGHAGPAPGAAARAGHPAQAGAAAPGQAGHGEGRFAAAEIAAGDGSGAGSRLARVPPGWSAQVRAQTLK